MNKRAPRRRGLAALAARAAAAALAALLMAPAGAAPLKLCYEDVPMQPWTTPQGGGLNLDLLRRVAAELGEQFEMTAKPWKRCLEELRSGQVDGLIGAADAPARRAFSLPPLLPDGRANAELALYTDSAYVFIRAGSPASWDGKDLVNPRGEIVAQRDYLVANILRERGYKVRDTIKLAEDALRMLAANAIDVAVLQSGSAAEMVKIDPRYRGRINQAKTPYMVMPFYLMIGREVYAREPKRIDAIWNAIGTVRATPEYRAMEAEAIRTVTPE
ncbi:MAG: transporter substrate-binding domain-containing protein [Pseudomonadota bacterium]